MHVLYPPINNKYNWLLVAAIINRVLLEDYGINSCLIREENK